MSFLSFIGKLPDNPLLLKELRSGFRDAKNVVFLVVFVGFFAFKAFGMNSDFMQEGDLGQWAFLFVSGEHATMSKSSLFWLQYVFLSLIMPSVASTLLSSEKENHSMDLLLTSRLTPRDIVAGKFTYSIVFSFVLLLAVLPVFYIVVLMGGTAPLSLLKCFFILCLNAFMLNLVCICISSRENKSRPALVLSYLCSFILFFVAISNNRVLMSFLNNELSIFSLTCFFYSINFIYLAYLLFTKAINYIKPDAKREKRMLLVFSLWFFLFCLSLGFMLPDLFTLDNQNDPNFGLIWCLVFAISYIAGCCFLLKEPVSCIDIDHDLQPDCELCDLDDKSSKLSFSQALLKDITKVGYKWLFFMSFIIGIMALVACFSNSILVNVSLSCAFSVIVSLFLWVFITSELYQVLKNSVHFRHIVIAISSVLLFLFFTDSIRGAQNTAVFLSPFYLILSLPELANESFMDGMYPAMVKNFGVWITCAAIFSAVCRIFKMFFAKKSKKETCHTL